MDTDSFIIHIKTEDVYEDIADDIETRFFTTNYKADRPLPTGKNKNAIRLLKDESVGNIIRELAGLRQTPCSYLMDDGNSDKKAEGTQKM